MRARARVVQGFPTGTDPDGVEIPILDGDVQLDATADVRSTLDLTTTDTWTKKADGLLTPYGNEIFVERGIDYSDGTTEWVSLGYFRIDEVEQQTAPRGTVRIAGVDRMAQVIESRLTVPEPFDAGDQVSDVFTRLINTDTIDLTRVFAGTTMPIEYDYDSMPSIGAAATAGAAANDSRYDFLTQVITPADKVMFFDHRGYLVVRSRMSSTQPVFTIDAGRQGVLTALTRGLSRKAFYNGVVASGDAVDGVSTPPKWILTNLDASDPLRWGGPFGAIPRFYTSPFIVDFSGAESAATSLLSRYVGLPYSVNLQAVPNPALETLDLIEVNAGDGMEKHILDKLTIPLTTALPMSGTTRTMNLVEVTDE
jgi:hypothetical protein